MTPAGTRAEAEATAAEVRPDLAILDLMMERHDDGFVLSHHLKRLLPGLPVILVTAVTAETGISFTPTSGAERAWVGADAMLAKPIRFEQLKREVESIVDTTKAATDAETSQALEDIEVAITNARTLEPVYDLTDASGYFYKGLNAFQQE